MFKGYSSEKISRSQAFLWIVLSTLIVSGSALMGWLYYQQMKGKRIQDEQYRIVAIVQSCPQQEALKTGYLAELLGLSVDQPSNLYQFNIREGEDKLLNCPLIKQASIQKILPGTLYIRYELRVPIAYLGDYSNTVVDDEGVIFPFHPFFTPKRIPTVYLGLNDSEKRWEWGSDLIDHPHLHLAFDLLQTLKNLGDGWEVKQIDVADAYADSDGKRQGIVSLAERESLLGKPGSLILLRLNPKFYRQNLANFFSLKKKLNEQKWAELTAKRVKSEKTQPLIFDLRISQLAFIQKYN